jgi:bacillithiol biosynthesis cysteine-adding enzyme BshC
MANFSVSYRSLRQTGAFSKLVLDYTEGKQNLRDAFPNNIDLDSIIQAAHLQKERDSALRRGVSDRIHELYSCIDQPNIDGKQLARLGHENTRFVVTAHQPILLGGPLYVFYKLSSVVALAKRLNEHPNKKDLHFIPLYWVGDEDHDIEEIGHCHVLGKKISWMPKQGGATGRMLIEDAEEFLSPLEAILGHRPESDRWMRLARDCYRNGITLLEATVRWTDALFGSAGLVVFSGDDPRLKNMALHLWEKEINQRFSGDAALRGSDQLVEMGYHAQISPRSVNLFWLEEESRSRLVRLEDGGWQAGEQVWANDQAMIHQIHADPGMISPNVVLRPLYQEFLLQSAAFIGGPAELAYWLQLYPVFQEAGVDFPPVLPRASIMLMDAAMCKRWEQLELTDDMFFQSKENWVRYYLNQQSESRLSDFELIEKIRQGYLQLSQEAAMIDPSLKSFVLAELTKAEKSVESIAHRVLKARKQKSEVQINRLHQLHDRLFPDNKLQERYDNFLGWVASDPDLELFDYCLHHLDYPAHYFSIVRLGV